MTATEILDRLNELGVEVELIGDQVQVTPVSKVPHELLDEAKLHKAEIVRELSRCYGDGQLPPLDRPLETEQELKRWYDYTEDPKSFADWMKWNTAPFDSSEYQSI